MRGAHSIRKHSTAKAVTIVIVVLVIIALAGSFIFMRATGTSLSSLLPPQVASLLGLDAANPQPGDDESAPAADDEISPPEPIEGVIVDGAYHNERFGFALTLPEGFAAIELLPDNEGAVFLNEDLDMTARVSGSNNMGGLDADALLATLWSGSEDSIARAEGNRVIIYQYDDELEYFYWVYVGPGSINQLEITYPLQDDNRAELDASQALMEGFTSGDVSVGH